MALGLFGRPTIDPSLVVEFVDELEHPDDLPCPWCRTATRETDNRCPGCQRRFG